jgi:hypothetical protein
VVKRKIALSTFLVILVIVVGIYFFNNSKMPVGTPVMDFDYQIFPLNTQDYNVTQGSNFEVNLTFTSIINNQIVIPLENLSIAAFNSTISYSNWDTRDWNKSITDQQVFSYSFGLKQLNLQPLQANYTILTINIEENAPTGCYELDLNIGKITDPISGLTYFTTIPIDMIIRQS